MRIAMISTPFVPVPPRDYGGTELVVHELVEGLVAAGHDVTLFATGDSRTSAELRACFDQARWPPNPVLDLTHLSWALRQVADGSFDIVHVHSAAALAVARAIPDIRLVYTLHHSHDEALSVYYGHFPEVQFVAISTDQRSREPGLARCRVIHHGLDPSRYQWIAQPGGYVCFVGRLAQEKGPHVAIDVAATARVPIVLAGRAHPPDRGFAEQQLAERLGMRHVSYLGSIDMARKAPLLRNARALLAPVDWDEPFGLILIEAMLSGCPVVAFARGSVPELVEPGVTGFIVQSPEEMAAVIAPGGPADRIDRHRCRLRAVRRFSRARFVSDHERLYTSLIAESAPAGLFPITAA